MLKLLLPARVLLPPALVLLPPALVLLLPLAALAAPATWATDAGVGANEVDFRLQITCPNTSLVCSLVDGYDDTRTSTATGGGGFDLDADNDSLQFDNDSVQDVGSGPQDAYLTLTGTDLVFANIPFAGVPEIVNVLVFALTSPVISVAGVDLSSVGDTPFSETLSYSGLADVTGDLEFVLPGIVVPPDDVLLSGTLRVLGDVDSDGMTELELRDLTGSFSLQTLATVGGEPVTLDITADVTMNLSGETEAPADPGPPQIPVPALADPGLALLALALAASAGAALYERAPRRRSRGSLAATPPDSRIP